MIKKYEIADPDSCLNHSHDDEPLFVLCARDKLAVSAVDHWIREAEHAGVSDMKLNDARRLKTAMLQWRTQIGGGKIPD